MLRGHRRFKDIVLIGSTSNIGIALINQIVDGNFATIHLVGRQNPDPGILFGKNLDIKFHYLDFSQSLDVARFVNDLSDFKDAELVVVALGYLPEELSEFDLNSISNALQINTLTSILVLSSFANLLHIRGGGSILVCSSVASMRPRLRNFSYGASKSALDFYARGLQNRLRDSQVRVTVLRPGFVFTKMTDNFSPAPFAIKLPTLAKIAAKGIRRGRKIVYAPQILKYVMLAVRILPNWIVNKF